MNFVFVSSSSGKLYLATVRRTITSRRGGSYSVVTVVMSDPYYRVVRTRTGKLAAIGVSEAAFRGSCSISGTSVVLNDAKTPMHRSMSGFRTAQEAVSSLSDAIVRLGFDVSPVNERAVSASEVLNPAEVQGAVVHTVRRNSMTETTVVLYDFDDAQVVSMVKVRRYGSSDDFWEVQHAFARDGYGPTAYDLALAHVSPQFLKPDVVIKPDAVRVWEYYMSRRSDVRKVPLDPKNLSYANAYAETSEDDFARRDPGVLRVINTKFQKQPTREESELFARGVSLCKEYGITPSRIASIAAADFQRIYRSLL